MNIRHFSRFASVFTLLYSLSLAADSPPSPAMLEKPGPFTVGTYTDFPAVTEFKAGTIYYPQNKASGIGGVAISPGFVEAQENMSWWGPHLASHGFAVLTLDTNELRDQPDVRANALMAAIGILRGENNRDGSPLEGKIDTEKMAIMGHSMGGGGTLLAASANSATLKAAIPFTPWLREGSYDNITIPTLIIAGEIDRIAPKDQHAWPMYQKLADDLPRMYLEIKGGNHFIANTDTEGERLSPNIDVHDLVGRMGLAWLKLYVDGDESYRSILFGELSGNDSERLSRWEKQENN